MSIANEIMRSKLPSRRASVTENVRFTTESGTDKSLNVTFGFSPNGVLQEVFTASFKTGSDTHALIMDACILLSTLMQHGYSPAQLAQKLCHPPSLIGTVAAAAARMEQEIQNPDELHGSA